MKIAGSFLTPAIGHPNLNPKPYNSDSLSKISIKKIANFFYHPNSVPRLSQRAPSYVMWFF